MRTEDEFGLYLVNLAAFAAGVLAALIVVIGRDTAQSDFRGVAPAELAVVNGEPIRLSDYQLALAAIAADKREPLSASDRRLALTKLLQEELLLQEAMRRDLIRKDDVLRMEITIVMLEFGASRGAPVLGDTSVSRAQALDEYLRHLRAAATLQRTVLE